MPDGSESFSRIEYIGGDATQPKKLYGWLVLTDSTLEWRDCTHSDCRGHKDGEYFKREARFTIPLRTMTELASSSEVRGASVESKLLIGSLAGDRRFEYVLVVYEHATSAEAPVFKTQKAQSDALEAKIRFRLKRLGITLQPPDTAKAQAAE